MACQTRLPHCVTGLSQRTVTSSYANTEDGWSCHHGSSVSGSADFRSIGLDSVIERRGNARNRSDGLWILSLTGAICLVSFIDDRRGLPIAVRFGIHLVADGYSL